MTRDLRIVAFALLLWGLGEGLFIYFQPIYLNQLGADPVQIGGILGLAGFAFMISHLPAGVLADVAGRKSIMVAAWFGGMLSVLIMFLADSLAFFLAGIILYSFTGFVLAPLQSYITNAKGSWTVTRALTTTQAFFSIGSVIGPILGGLLGEFIGLKIIYGIATGVFLLSSILILSISPQPIEETEDGPRYQNLLKNKSLAGFLILAFVVLFAMYLSWPLTPVFLQEERSVSVGILGFLGSLYASGMVVLNLIFGRMNPRLSLIVAQVAVGFSVLMLWKGASNLCYSLGYFFAAGFRVTRSLITAQVETLVKQIEMGLAFGFSETVNGSVILLASPFAGVLYDLKPDLPFIVSMGLIGIALILTLRFMPPRNFSRSTVAAADTTNE
jgi:MFS family permease